MANKAQAFDESLRLNPQSSDPSNPLTGQIFYSDGTSRSEGLWQYDGTNWVQVGSGSGSSGINYIQDSISGYALYDDGATATPVDGSGGSPSTITLTSTTSSSEVLRLPDSLKLSKSAADGQGEGISYDFSIDPRDKYADLYVSCDYKNSANFVSGDVQLFVYDIDNATLLGAVSNDQDGDILSHTGNGSTFQGSFQATDSDSYRLIFHITSTNASAWDLFLDSVTVTPQATVPVPIITEWQSYTPVTQGFGTLNAVEAWYRRNGQDMEIRAKFTSGTVTSDEAQFGLPGSFQADADLVAAQYNNANIVGVGTKSVFGSIITITLDKADTGVLKFGVANATSLGLNYFHGDQILSSTEQLSFYAKFPILGWSTGAVLSTNDFELQSIIARYDVSASSTNLSFADEATEIVDFDNKIIDTHNTVTTGTGWVFTAPRTGKYFVTSTLSWDAPVNTSGSFFDVYINGSFNARLDDQGTATANPQLLQGDVIVELTKGDELNIQANQNDTAGAARSIRTPDGLSFVSIASIPDFKMFSVFRELNRWQLKTLAANNTSAGTLTDLTFSNLTIGKTYRTVLKASFFTSTAGGAPFITIVHDGNTIDQAHFNTPSADSDGVSRFSVTTIFVATATTLTFVSGSTSATDYVQGDGTRANTYSLLEELNNYSTESSSF